MIGLHHITKYYKVDFWKSPLQVLNDVSFEINEGQIVGFLGPNGAGKTTSIKIILGLSGLDGGSIDHSKLGATRNEFLKNVGYMPERPYYYPNSTGRELVTYLGQLSGLSLSDIKGELSKWAPRLTIDHALDRQIRTYSKGMLQRIGIISAIIHRPKLVILDEPVSGLDPIGRKEIKDILVELRTKMGMAVFFSTHIVPDVEEICDRVVFLQKGKVVCDGPIADIIGGGNAGYNITYEENGSTKHAVKTAAEKDAFMHEILRCGGKVHLLNRQAQRLEDVLYLHEKR